MEGMEKMLIGTGHLLVQRGTCCRGEINKVRLERLFSSKEWDFYKSNLRLRMILFIIPT